jgi:hypothetical protein
MGKRILPPARARLKVTLVRGHGSAAHLPAAVRTGDGR